VTVDAFGTSVRLEVDVDDKFKVTVDGAVLERLVVGETVTVKGVVFVLAVGLGEDVDEDELADAVVVMVMFVGT
jgi:hypothetical protein